MKDSLLKWSKINIGHYLRWINSFQTIQYVWVWSTKANASIIKFYSSIKLWTKKVRELCKVSKIEQNCKRTDLSVEGQNCMTSTSTSTSTCWSRKLLHLTSLWLRGPLVAFLIPRTFWMENFSIFAQDLLQWFYGKEIFLC
jgi:hypothetical protein